MRLTKRGACVVGITRDGRIFCSMVDGENPVEWDSDSVPENALFCLEALGAEKEWVWGVRRWRLFWYVIYGASYRRGVCSQFVAYAKYLGIVLNNQQIKKLSRLDTDAKRAEDRQFMVGQTQRQVDEAENRDFWRRMKGGA